MLLLKLVSNSQKFAGEIIIFRPYLYMEETTQRVCFLNFYLPIENVRISEGSEFEFF